MPSRNPGIWAMDEAGSNQKKLTERGLDPALIARRSSDRVCVEACRGVFQVYTMNPTART